MTPLELEVLMHIYVTPLRFPHLNHLGSIVGKFLKLGILEASDTESGYVVSDLGRAWIYSILSTPIPKMGYIGQDGKLIDL